MEGGLAWTPGVGRPQKAVILSLRSNIYNNDLCSIKRSAALVIISGVQQQKPTRGGMETIEPGTAAMFDPILNI